MNNALKFIAIFNEIPISQATVNRSHLIYSKLKNILESRHSNHAMEKLINTYSVSREMLSDRGYILPEFVDLDPDLESSILKESMEYDAQTPTGNKIKVFWLQDSKLNVDAANMIGKICIDNGLKSIIVVIKASVTPPAKIAIKNLMAAHLIAIEIFTEAELSFNYTKHKYVPKHTLCDKDELQAVCKQYGVTKQQLPEILTTDPISRWLGAKRGQLIMIERTLTAYDTMPGQVSVSYRIVV